MPLYRELCERTVLLALAGGRIDAATAARVRAVLAGSDRPEPLGTACAARPSGGCCSAPDDACSSPAAADPLHPGAGCRWCKAGCGSARLPSRAWRPCTQGAAGWAYCAQTRCPLLPDIAHPDLHPGARRWLDEKPQYGHLIGNRWQDSEEWGRTTAAGRGRLMQARLPLVAQAPVPPQLGKASSCRRPCSALALEEVSTTRTVVNYHG